MRTKKAFLAGTLLLLLAAGARAGIREDFAAANRLYGEGKYAAALSRYQRIAAETRDWQLPYNIGNCHYKLGDYLSAKVYYLKARKIRPLEPAIQRNIALTNRRFRDQASLPAPDFITRAVQRLESWLPLDALSLLLLAAVLLLNIFLFLLLTRGRRKKLVYGLAFSLLFAAGTGACHIVRTAALERSDSAVVRAEDSHLHSGPGAGNTVLFTVHPGLELRIIDRQRDWVQVAASESIAGWIEKRKLILI